MSPPTPSQLRRRDRVEQMIALAAPLLDLVLKAGDAISHAVDRGDGYQPVPAAAAGFELPSSHEIARTSAAERGADDA